MLYLTPLYLTPSLPVTHLSAGAATWHFWRALQSGTLTAGQLPELATSKSMGGAGRSVESGYVGQQECHLQPFQGGQSLSALQEGPALSAKFFCERAHAVS